MNTKLSETQKQILTQVAERLRRSADHIDAVVESGDEQVLAELEGLLHVSDTQIRWVKHAHDC